MHSGHAKQLSARLPPLITLNESGGLTNLSVGWPVRFEMCEKGDTSHAAAPARQTVIEMARVALAVSLWTKPHSFSCFHQESTVDVSISACSQTSMPSNLCAMITLMLTTAFRMPLSRSLHLCPPRISMNMWTPLETLFGAAVRSLVSSEIDLLSQLARWRSRRRPSRIHRFASMFG